MKARPQGWRSIAVFCFAIVAGAACVAPAHAIGNPNEIVPFHIEPGDAEVRLNEFSTQSGLQMLFNYEVMRGIPTKPVRGEFKPFDALDKMIAGTDIRYEFINKRTVTLTRVAPGVKRPTPRASEGQARNRPRNEDRRAPDMEVEEVTIFSAHANSLSSPGAAGFTLKRAEIDALGFATVPGLVRTLPQVFGGGPTEDTTLMAGEARTNTARGSGINFRGLGASSTLVLLNGHRLAASGTEGLFVDVSNLPPAAVERIDILPDSSSTFYGADAVGGVANFVMRDSFEGQQTEAYFGTATKGHLNENYVSQLIGRRSDKGHGTLAFDFYSRDNLPAADREQARSDLRQFGGSNFDVLQSNPGNIVIGPFTWAIPSGQDGKSLEPSDLVAGTPNWRNRYEGADLLPSQQRWSMFGSGRRHINDRLSLFGDVLAGQRNVHNTGVGQVVQLPVPRTNPYYVNPTGGQGTVVVNYNLIDDFGPLNSEARVKSSDAVIGADLKLRDWKVSATLGHAAERMRVNLYNTVDGAKLFQALAESDPAKAFNPFGDGSNTPASVLDSLRTEGLLTTRSSVLSGGLIASGLIGELPGGSVALSFGGDVREQSFKSENRQSASATPLGSDLSRTIHSGFVELLIPLVGPNNRFWGAEAIDISLAERYETYSDFGDVLAPRFGLSWMPLRGLTVRSTYSESFRPPGLLDLDESSNSHLLLPLLDPQTGGLSTVLIWSGKNRALSEEKARSWTIGLEVAPDSLPNTAVALTYFNTKFNDRLSQPTFSFDLLSNPALASLITRNPSAELQEEACTRAPLGSPIAACLATPIAAVADVRMRNDARMHTSGIDLLARYSMDTQLGRFSFGLNGTYTLDFSEAKVRNEPLENFVSTPHYPVNLRFRTSAGWHRGGTEVSMSVNYQNNYIDTLSVPRRNIASWTTADLRAAYSFGASDQHWLGDTTISLGVNNLFDAEPPFVNNSLGIGYDQENGDLTGRIASVTIRKKW
jgi:iron complex outermembrane recepter protein